MAFLFYAMLLKRLPLSLAQAIMSMQFVLVIIAANFLLGEQIDAARWVGIALMAVGLAVIGFSPGAAR
jgi:undecaprenyl phosphate-alpha-L-ara4N flippase subunit ArnE